MDAKEKVLFEGSTFDFTNVDKVLTDPETVVKARKTMETLEDFLISARKKELQPVIDILACILIERILGTSEEVAMQYDRMIRVKSTWEAVKRILGDGKGD